MSSKNLGCYTEESKSASKTEVVVGALAQYLGCFENLPLSQRVAELEARMGLIEASIKKSATPEVI